MPKKKKLAKKFISNREMALMEIAFKAGREWEWVSKYAEDGLDRNFERSLKNKKKARLLCPICNPKLVSI